MLMSSGVARAGIRLRANLNLVCGHPEEVCTVALRYELSCSACPSNINHMLVGPSHLQYENGVQEELLFLGNVIESSLPDGGVSIICYQAAEHLVFDGYSLVQYGHLKVVFNAAKKVQLYDFSVTGYDLHLSHGIVHTEMKSLSTLLEQRLTGLTISSAAGTMDQRLLMDTLRSMTEVRSCAGKGIGRLDIGT